MQSDRYLPRMMWTGRASRRSLLVALAIAACAAITPPVALASPLYKSVILRDKPISYWRLGERPGSAVAKDSSGHGNNGTYASCVQLGVKGAITNDPNTAAIFGQQPGCWMVAQPVAGGHAGDYTVEAWIKTTSTTKLYQTFLDSRSPNGEFSFDCTRRSRSSASCGKPSGCPGEGKTIPEAAKELGISEQTFHRWRYQYGGMKVDDAKRLREFERENARLKVSVADQALENQALKEIAKGN